MGKWTRRAFITTGVLAGGAVVFGVAVRPGNRAKKVKDLIAKGEDTVLNIWLKLSPDNTLTAIIPHAEMGQGTHTALAMMLADEMDADWSLVRMEEAPAHKEYANYAVIQGFVAGKIDFPAFMVETIKGSFLTIAKGMNFQITGGSSSVCFTGNYAMRVTGAAAKSMLLEAAANAWEVPVEELTAKNSHIYHQATDRSAPFAEFAQAAAELEMPTTPKLKSTDEFTIMGTSPGRFDIPAKVNGTAGFGMDVVVPGMKYATVKAAPVFGARLTSVDESAITDMKGVDRVVKLENAVAVIADGFWQAKQALAALNPEFETTEKQSLNSESIFQQFSNQIEKAISEDDLETEVEKGNAPQSISEANSVFEAEYQLPYLAHATMEPMNCTAWVRDGKCDVWIGCQNPLGFRDTVAEVLGIEPEMVTIHNQYLGGGFGRRSDTDVVKQAVNIAREVDFPVKLIWSREEDIQQGTYREANVSKFKAGLDENGFPVAWVNYFVDKHHPPAASHPPYQIDNQLVQYTTSPTHIPWGNWRSVDHSMHGFFIESFIDELAHQAKKDPYQYRRELLAHQPRMVKLLDTVAEKSGWGKELPKGHGQGIAIHESFGSMVAEVAEVAVIDGKLKVLKVYCAADAGMAIHPDGFIAQMESGIIFGLTAAMYGEIIIENGAVKQSNFHDYQMIRMDTAPEIETYIINSDAPIGGAGEPGTPPIAAALTNAIFAATGKRIRKLPVGEELGG
ncbi:MAG: molybdopterin cofactor-binding domain-containing protein [Bacteroidia bacterium]